MSDWTHIRFLESAENLKQPIQAITGRKPSTSIAREVGVCLQQGRLFFESAERSGLEIRPLLLFYGTLAFAKALVVGLNQQSLSALPKSHGISDVSSSNALLTELTVRIGSSGTFQQFNDVAARLNRFEYYDRASMPQGFTLPAAGSAQLENFQFTLQEILSRIPGLEKTYRLTFQEPANVESVSINPILQDETFWELRTDDRELFSDRASLLKLVRKWRNRFPVLERMRVIEAVHAWDNSIILFGNVPVPANDLDEEFLSEEGDRFAARGNPARNPKVPRVPIEELIGPDGGSFSGSRVLMAPHRGVYASRYSLQYIGLFLLSSLVRYRPQSWVHAISRSVTGERPADDQALALIEAFMNLHSTKIPGLVSTVFDPERRA